MGSQSFPWEAPDLRGHEIHIHLLGGSARPTEVGAHTDPGEGGAESRLSTPHLALFSMQKDLGSPGD